MPEFMSQLGVAAGEFTALVRTLRPADLTARTPCAEFDVRGLVGHLLYWGPWLAAAGRKAPPPVGAVVIGDDWAAALEKQTAELVEVFGRAEAGEGMTSLGTAELPAEVVGEMVLGEFVLHGWDLAVATGRGWESPPEVVEAVYGSVTRMGERARGAGVYGPEVAVGASATAWERLLGASGRDVGWRGFGPVQRHG